MPASSEEIARYWVNNILATGHFTTNQLVEDAKRTILTTLERQDAHDDFLKILVNRAYACHLVIDPPPIECMHTIMQEMYNEFRRCPSCNGIVVDDYYVSYREREPVVLCSSECLHDWIS